MPGARRLRLAGAISLFLSGCLVARSPAPEPAAPDGAPAAGAGAVPPVNGGLVIAPIEDFTPQPPILPLSPAEQQQRFVLPPGYRMEPVLTEPAIQEPAAIAFDGNGRMFVLELRTYMQDADATGELAPGGRISMHEDADNDGVYERHSVFVDGLVFPRFVLPFGANSILTMESNEDDVYRYTDTDGDGRADRKELFTTRFGRPGNVEHQQAFLFWGMDNWLYSTYNAFRVRWTPEGVLRERTGANGAQWGVTQDNDGKIWFQGGASGHPSHFQFPIHYGNFRIPEQFEPGFEEPWGLAGLGDFQPGPTASRPDGTLNRVTGSAGNDVFRGHRLPADLVGDYLYGEPVARVVRRVRPVVAEGVTQLRNVYQPQRAEFIRSTDPLFRPVDLATAPDGTLYVVDMYRGIIQEGNWTQPGTHLRKKIEQYGLDKVVSNGRIWRLVHDGMERDRRQPRMLEETAQQLTRHLEHPNGWWRDMAQQLLVLRQDRSVVPALRGMARTSPNLLARFHALWTLEGLGGLDAALARELMRDPEPRMRIQAIRASETLYKAGDRSLAEEYRRLAADPVADVVVQAMLTLNTLEVPDAEVAIRAAMAANSARGVQLVADQIVNRPPPSANLVQLTAAERALVERGAAIYGELCAQCHGEAGKGVAYGEGGAVAPALAGSPRVQGHPEYVVRTLLHGLSGPIDGKTYAGQIMVPMGENTDEWVAAVASYIRKSLTNNASMVAPEQVARVRAATADRRTPWSYDELMASIPHPLAPQPGWKASASHSAPTRVGGTADPLRAFTYEGWTTGAAQRPGMWFQVELPEPVRLAEIQFHSPGQRVAGQEQPRSTAPRGYRVQVSTDGRSWSAPVAEGQGSGEQTVISFAPVRARYLRITQTAEAEDAPAWTMQQLRLLQAGGR